MPISDYNFERWNTRCETSWAWRVFKKHNDELMRMYISFYNSKKFVYKNLGLNGAQWTDFTNQHFNFDLQWEGKYFTNLKNWSDAFNDLENWINLNSLVSLSSCLETYIATIVPLALESNVGILFGTTHRIDGIEIIKHGKDKPFDFNQYTIGCTKGDWQARYLMYIKAFGKCPDVFVDNISTLEKIRNIRNDVAHAMGRDIEASRNNGQLKILPSIKLSKKQFINIQSKVWNIAKGIDNHLLNEHIGEYENLLFYHKLYPKLNKKLHPSMRAIEFKKQLGSFGEIPAGKKFCKGLVNYYENI